MLTLIRQSVWGRDFGVSGSSIGCAKAMLGSVFDVVFREPLPGFIEEGEVSDELAIGIIRRAIEEAVHGGKKNGPISAIYSTVGGCVAL
jgi:hypothetical protein